ncbi:serine/threonine-protein phosphatase 4 regulatory subunit 3-like [Heracleum sosnowskyi]|uniref:Serine/threonine-protein phosphatase 4 regulatory subunit 3-like n=1 Tax=Heracleum sosnowskyi TaxID=360622 RepID=A0AAD8MZG5_9APIA|nr:serine/threonine-protein phosphatase 4 regulatory subunit 3-like [Heracleum sosnowskyi]
MGAQEKSPSSTSSMQRVKYYRLNEDGKWDDQGTGHVTVDYLERSEELGLFVVDEDDIETLLLHRIRSDDIYRKQEDTIISWRDPEHLTEVALSFQETTGCSYIWDQICSVQRSLQFNTLTNETYHTIHSELKDLPPVELSTLPSILKAVVESSNADQCRVAELISHDQDFFRKLIDLFRICEDLEDVDGLHLIFKIVRGIVLFNSAQIFERIFGEELIMDICGCLEYDPELPHVHHRVFLKEHVVFKEAIPIKDPQVLSKIHQTYKIGYLKDVVLPKILDEATTASLNSIIHSNNAYVVSMLKDDSTFIQELFARMKSPETPAESMKDLVLFLHEFCNLSKSLQMVHQLRLYRDFLNEGIIDIITNILQSQDKKIILTGTDIFILFLNQDSNLTRSFVTRKEGVPLLGLLVKGMLTDFGDDMHCQFLEILRSLLDSYASGSQRDTIIEIFYEKHLGQLIEVITSSCPPSSSGQTSSSSAVSFTSAKPEILLNICDLLCFCVSHHPFRIKCNFLLNNVIDKVLFLTRRREKYLVVAAVRFVRILISRNDDHLFNHIVKNNLLKPVIDVFVDNGNRYNLLNSAVLEFFEHVRRENFKILIKYIINSFWGQLVNFANFSSIHSLKVRYDQSLESLGEKGPNDVLEPRRRIDERALEKEEEDYFNEDSDEEDSASASASASASISRGNTIRVQPHLSNGSVPSPVSSRVGGLVDYDDDEDDEDYKPPPRKQPEVTEENEGILDPLRLKRKSDSKEELELVKRQRLNRNSKPKDGVLAALCSTLSQAVLPNKKIASAVHNLPQSPNSSNNSSDINKEEKGSMVCSIDSISSDVEKSEDRHSDVEKVQNCKESPSLQSCDESLHSTPGNGHQNVDDCPSIPSKPSAEMAVNGS